MHSSEEGVETKLCRIADKARKDPTCQFTSLFHLMTEEMLRGCFMRLKDNAAAGIDRVSKDEYALNLEENLADLVNCLHRMAYIPQPVKRVYRWLHKSPHAAPALIGCNTKKYVYIRISWTHRITTDKVRIHELAIKNTRAIFN